MATTILKQFVLVNGANYAHTSETTASGFNATVCRLQPIIHILSPVLEDAKVT